MLKKEPWKAHNLTFESLAEPSHTLPKMYRVVARVPCGTLARGVVRGERMVLGEQNRAVVVMPAIDQRQQRGMATEPGKRPSFFGNLLENLKSEYTKSKEMQDSLAKFREDAKKLEESDALKEARRKFQSIEGESAKTGGAFKDQLSGLTDKLKDTVEDLSKHESLKKASEFTGNLGEKTKGATESLGKAAEQLSQSSAFQVHNVPFTFNLQFSALDPFHSCKTVCRLQQRLPPA